MEKCCLLVAVSHNSSFKPTAKGHEIFTNCSSVNDTCPPKNTEVENRPKNSRVQPSKKTIWRGRLYSHFFFLFSFNTKEKGVEKWWILGIFKDMSTQITKTYQLTPVRMALDKNAANNKCWRDCGEMSTLDSKGDVVRATNESTIEVPWKGNIELPYQSINHTHGWVYHLRKWKSKSHRLAILHSSNSYHRQHLEATKTSINRGMHQEEVVHVHNGILAMENIEALLFEAPYMSLEIITKHEVGRKAKDLYPIISLMALCNNWHKWTYFQRERHSRAYKTNYAHLKGKEGGIDK